jgi:L-ascorbate metabolism protein UlaG (beta-lactamase superfamily)
MKITFIGHASILIEARGIRVLSDPWWRGPCFGAQWWTYPQPCLAPLKDGRVDYIYISHGHNDHFHPGTLRTLSRDAKVLVSANLDLVQPIRDLGFEVVVVGDDEARELAPGVTCRVIETHAGDTLCAVDDGREVCLNLNDSLHAAPPDIQVRFTKRLRALYPRLDYVFCGYGVASHFPNCYVIPGKDREATAAHRQAWFNQAWVRIIDALKPRFGFPFAADVAFLEDDLIWVNEPTHNRERPTTAFHRSVPRSQTAVIDIAPGFEIEDGNVTTLVERQPTSVETIRSVYRAEIERANRAGSATREGVEALRQLLEANVARCREYLVSAAYDYRFLLRFRNCDTSIEISKAGQQLDLKIVPANRSLEAYDVTYVTRLSYVRNSLSSRYGHEILFVGSGGIFEYGNRDMAAMNVHRELMTMLVPHSDPLPRRRSASRGVLGRAKHALKNVLRRSAADLYDVSAWTSFRSQ